MSFFESIKSALCWVDDKTLTKPFQWFNLCDDTSGDDGDESWDQWLLRNFIGGLECAGGGVLTFYGAMGLAQSLPTNNLMVMGLSGGMTIAGTCVFFDGLDRLRYFRWKKYLGMDWDGLFKTYLFGGALVLGGIYTEYRSVLAVLAVTETTSSTVGYAVVASLGAAGIVMLYFGYKKIKEGCSLTAAAARGTSDDKVYSSTNTTQSFAGLDYEVVSFNYTQGNEPTVYSSSLDESQRQCTSKPGTYVWDDETKRCITKTTWDNYQAAMDARKQESAEVEITNASNNGKDFGVNDVYTGKPIKDFTCDDWFQYNNPLLGGPMEPGTKPSHFQIMMLEQTAPDECLTALRTGQSLAFIPSRESVKRLNFAGYTLQDEDFDKPLSALNPLIQPNNERTTRDVDSLGNQRKRFEKYTGRGKNRVSVSGI